MYTMVDVKQYRENSDGTDLVVSVPGMKLGGLLQRKKIKNAEIRFDDGRHIFCGAEEESICNDPGYCRLDRLSTGRNEGTDEV